MHTKIHTQAYMYYSVHMVVVGKQRTNQMRECTHPGQAMGGRPLPPPARKWNPRLSENHHFWLIFLLIINLTCIVVSDMDISVTNPTVLQLELDIVIAWNVPLDGDLRERAVRRGLGETKCLVHRHLSYENYSQLKTLI